jgi:1-deoxyxylulose-5-phosphate synthase
MRKEEIMKYGEISGVGQPVSRLILGTMVCTTDEQEKSNELLDAFVEVGGNCLDSAHVYGGGKSERAVGQWMKERGNRDKILVIDKGAHPYWTEPRVNPEGIAQDITESLERLQSDYIDLYLLHRDDENVPVGPIVEHLNKERDMGRIRAFGGSNWTTARVQEANDYAAQHGLTGFVASSPHFSLAVSKEPMWAGCIALDDAGRQWHKTTQFPMLPWSSQARGFFTGRYSPEDTSNENIVRVYYSEENWERLRRAEELGEKHSVTANNIALAYVLHEPYPVFALFGPATAEELHNSLPALDIALTDSERATLELKSPAL